MSVGPKDERAAEKLVLALTIDMDLANLLDRAKKAIATARAEGAAEQRERDAATCEPLIGESDGSAYEDGVVAGKAWCVGAIRRQP